MTWGDQALARWEERKGSRGHSRLSERGQATSALEESGSVSTEQASEATVLVGCDTLKRRFQRDHLILGSGIQKKDLG